MSNNIIQTIMKKDLILKLAQYVAGTRKYIFVNEDFGWDEKDIAIDGFEYIPSMEGNGLKATTSGETYIPQYSTIRKANHLKLQLRSYNNEKTHCDEEVYLKDCQNDIIIITNNESVVAFAPVCKSKLEVAMFIATIEKWCDEDEGLDRRFDMHESIALAKFLYKNTPNKVHSLIDDL